MSAKKQRKTFLSPYQAHYHLERHFLYDCGVNESKNFYARHVLRAAKMSTYIKISNLGSLDFLCAIYDQNFLFEFSWSNQNI